MERRFPEYFWGIMTLAVATIVAAAVIGASLRGIRSGPEVLTVTGSARRPVTADFVVWRGAVTGQAATMQEAYQQVTQFSAQVRRYLKANGVPDTAVTYPAIENEQIQEWNERGQMTGRILGYRLTQRFEVRSPDVGKIAALARESSELINEGVPVMSFPPEFLVTKLAELRVDMLAEAAADAKLRAERIAEAAGSEVGALRSARMGVFQVTARNSTDVSDYGIYDTGSMEKDITAVVSLSFAID